MLVITGATGNIGGKITEKLLRKGRKVRVVGRNADRLQPMIDMGAEAAVGDLADTEFLTKAFTGAEAVFAIIPPNMTAKNAHEFQNTIGESIARAVKNANVKYVVNLSSIGAHLNKNTGVVLGLHDQEERLNNIAGLNVVHLRPGFFMENLLSTIDMIKSENIIGSALDSALRFPVIATKDVADIAATYLENPTFTGHTVRNLLGQRDVDYNEIVRVLGNAIGKKDLAYVQFPYEDARKAMVQTGISVSVAEALTEMEKTMNDGQFLDDAKRTNETSTPTSIEDFSKTFATIYKK